MVAYRQQRQARFSTVRVEGAHLPLDLLWRIVHRDQQVEGLTPQDYHLPLEQLNEAISNSWLRVRQLWQAFKGARDRASPGDSGTTLTRTRWLLPLLKELNYGMLHAASALEVEGRSYAISHSWNHVPIHLVSYKDDLDRVPRRASGQKRHSHYGLVQDLLNRSKSHLWGIVSNGLSLRILRQNVSLTRQEYIEFNLEAMLDGELYAEFMLLWLLCHPSRLEAQRPEDCWLEKWALTARQQGVRALDRLRDNVEFAIVELGQGFLKHSANTELLHKLRSGQLTGQDYYRQVLRLVYRLLVLLVAEDRDILFDPASIPESRERYTRFYSVSHLRDLSEKMIGTRHSDLYYTLRLVMRKLGEEGGCPELGLPALNGYLFSHAALADLEECQISNHALLAAVRALSYISSGRTRRLVDYRHLGAEEFGSVYESLLELHPFVDLESKSFKLESGKGNERKLTGTYYTHPSLVQCLLDSTLDPVLDEACAQPDPCAALLNLKICDPACGSGHFLVAGARRIAARLVEASPDEEAFTPQFYRKALRKVVGACIYGVDINPMAVELCKVALWLDAIEPGKPLSFFDAHIQCGNSLLGVTPALLKDGIPDSAFEAIEGDDKKISAACRRENKEFHAGQRSLREHERWLMLSSCDMFNEVQAIEAIDDETFTSVHLKANAYNVMIQSETYTHRKLLADAWCAAFVWRKQKYDGLLTEEVLRRLKKEPDNIDAPMKAEIERLTQQYQFFHWHIAFPGVFVVPEEEPENVQTGWSGGFDIILGNPPWEKIKIQEKEWFAAHRPDIANAANAAQRRKMIKTLQEDDSALYTAFHEDLRQAEGESHLIRHSGRYPLCGRGDVNTYAIFAENIRQLIQPRGRIGYILPSGIATDDTTKLFFQDLMEQKSLSSFFNFENEAKLFPGIDHRVKFSLLTLVGSKGKVDRTDFIFGAYRTEDLQEEWRRFSLSAQDIALLNPNTRTCPIFRSKRDMELTRAIYARVPVLIEEGAVEINPWEVTFASMFHMTNDSHLFSTYEQLMQDGWDLVGNVFRKGANKYLPLYEAKMIWHFDHRFGTYDNQTQAQANQNKLPELDSHQHADPHVLSLPHYWIEEGVFTKGIEGEQRSLLAFRDVTNAVVLRTAVFCTIPMVPCGNSLSVCYSKRTTWELLYMQTSVSSFAFDYVARQKLGGTHLNFFILKQLPVLPPNLYRAICPWLENISLGDWIFPRALELTYTAWDLEDFAKGCGYEGPPFRWDEARRFLLRCELDAVYFHLYGIQREDVDYIMDTFRVYREKEVKQHGEYRTKRVILEIYDEMQRAMESSEAYQTRLAPPPADPRVAHGEKCHEYFSD